jgi:hypothetical protein
MHKGEKRWLRLSVGLINKSLGVSLGVILSNIKKQINFLECNQSRFMKNKSKHI